MRLRLLITQIKLLTLFTHKMKNKKDKFPELMAWFDMMNAQFSKIEESNEKSQINNLLNDNDINPVK